MRRVIFIQSKIPIHSTEISDLLARWDIYGQLIHERSRDGGIWIYSNNILKNVEESLVEYKYIQTFESILEKSVSLKRFMLLSREIRRGTLNFTLVCGDNQKSLLTSLFLKFMNPSRVKIQTQFHGDTYSFRWNLGTRGFLRVIFSRLAICFSDSIRIVSKFQIDEIREFNPRSAQKYVLAPIPINFARIATNVNEKVVDVAFIGRLHPERGITELVKIIECLKVQYPNIKIAIAGDGPLRGLIENRFSHWIREGSLLMLGYLNESQVQNLYGKSKVLISSAPREGYGLTLREAALSDMLIVAHTSKGAQEASDAYPNQIKIYHSVDEAVFLINKCIETRSDKLPISRISAQKETDLKGLERLVSSWLAD
jgi:glycosyltransferase involved in cell wall biosynthesis